MHREKTMSEDRSVILLIHEDVNGAKVTVYEDTVEGATRAYAEVVLRIKGNNSWSKYMDGMDLWTTTCGEESLSIERQEIG